MILRTHGKLNLSKRTQQAIIATLLLLIAIFYIFDTVPADERMIKALSIQQLKDKPLSDYYGEIKRLRMQSCGIGGWRGKRFPGKAMICFYITGTKAAGRIEFTYTKTDTIPWVLESYDRGSCRNLY